MFGWVGKILRVNLSRGTIKTEPLEQSVARAYLGGRGLATYLHAKEVPASVEPLSAGNNLVFACGPLTGTLAPNGGRFALVAKGLPAGSLTAASIGGGWGPELKFAGFDAIIFEGKAPQPAYLRITDGEADLFSASHLRGHTVSETTLQVRSETGERAKVCCIGPAGENGVNFAVVSSGNSTSAGSAGIGAVMGFKNLKAVAVQGTQGFRVAAPGKLLRVVSDIRARIAARPITCKGLKLRGSALVAESAGQEADRLDGGSALPQGCFACPVRISSFAIQKGDSRTPSGQADSEVIRLAGELQPDRAGGQRQLDELFVDLGLDAVAMRTVLARCEGDGSLDPAALASKIAYGQDAGQSLVRWLESHVVGMAEDDYPPADHSGCAFGGYPIIPRIVHYDGLHVGDSVRHCQALTAVADSALVCPFVLAAIDAADIAALLSAATGIDYSPDEIVRVGERITESAKRAPLTPGPASPSGHGGKET